MNKVYLTGDTHGFHDFEKIRHFHKYEGGDRLTKHDYLIICGDVACVWDSARHDRFLQNTFSEFPWTTLFVDGNHENHDLLGRYEVKEWNDGKVHFITNNLIHLMRGQVFTINGRTFFTMGGASSIDKAWRVEGQSWWAREMPSNEELEEGFVNLERAKYKVDYIISHCAPLKILDRLFRYKEPDFLNKYFDTVVNDTDFKRMFFGHYHCDQELDNIDGRNYTALYNRVMDLSEYEEG